MNSLTQKKLLESDMQNSFCETFGYFLGKYLWWNHHWLAEEQKLLIRHLVVQSRQCETCLKLTLKHGFEQI